MPLQQLLADLLGDIQRPAILWQALAIVLCVALGWGLARLLHRSWLENHRQTGLIGLGMGSFGSVLGPLLILGLLALVRFGMRGQYSVHLLDVAVPLAASLVVIRSFFYLLRRVFARHGPLGDTLKTFEKIFALLVWIGVALHITGVLPEVIGVVDRTSLPIGKNHISLADLVEGVVSIVILMMLALWAGAALEERLMKVEHMHSSSKVVLARMSRAVLILVAVLFSLSLAGLDLTVLSVFGGALGVGLGLGMQRIASNYVSGFIILLERSLTIGDPITLDKYAGRVARINTRYTVLRGSDGTQTLLPNEMLITGVVLNQSSTNRNVRATTKLTVSYDSDLSTLMPLLEALPLGVPRVLEDPAPNVLLNAFTHDGYELELGFWLGDPENGQGGPVSDVNKKIYALVQAGEIKLGRPSMDMRLLDAQMTALPGRTAHAP